MDEETLVEIMQYVRILSNFLISSLYAMSAPPFNAAEDADLIIPYQARTFTEKRSECIFDSVTRLMALVKFTDLRNQLTSANTFSALAKWPVKNEPPGRASSQPGEKLNVDRG